MLRKRPENLSLKSKLTIIFSICYDAYVMNPNISYIREYFGHAFMDASYSTRRLLSRFGLCYHPSHAIMKQNKEIDENLRRLKDKLQSSLHSVVVKADDFNWMHVRGLPASSNSNKFTEAK